MTASVSRPSMTAAAASAWPGRSSSHPNDSRATRSMRLPTAPIEARYPPLFACKQGNAITPMPVQWPFARAYPRESEPCTDRKSCTTPFWEAEEEMADFTKRFGRDRDPGTNAGGQTGSVAVGERGAPPVQGEETAGQRTRDHVHGDHDHDGVRDRDEGRGGVATRDRAATAGTAASARDVRARQRDEFGGLHKGSGVFRAAAPGGGGPRPSAALAGAPPRPCPARGASGPAPGG